MKPCLSTLFDQYDGLWGVFAVKKDTLYTLFDLQGHSHVQIFTYKDVSVCNVSSPNFHMFYDKRRVFPCKYLGSVMFMHKFTH